ncbi:MAG: choice-of-anchor J domain-containing protein [Duncaniella sp.]|nr:choice-of-anchor J domain-containing protein [Duncaniella sp.]
MKKYLTRIFTFALAAATAVSVAAAPVHLGKLKGQTPGKIEMNAPAKAASKAAPAAKGTKILPKVRNASSPVSGPFFTPALTAAGHFKAPYKADALNATAGMPNLLGSVVFADGWNDISYPPVGLYSVPTSATQAFEIKAENADASFGGVLVDDVYYTCEPSIFGDYIYGIYFVGHDINTGAEVYNETYSYLTTSMTYDRTTATVYGVAVVEEYYALVKIFFNPGEVIMEPVGVLAPANAGMWNSIACDGSGQLYGIYGDFEVINSEYVCTGSTLYRIDKETSALSKVGATGYDCSYASGAAFDPRSNRLFWTVCPSDGKGYLTEINTATGAATEIYHFPLNQEVTGLAVALPVAEDDAPAEVSDIVADFTGSSLSGIIRFKAPSTLFDGTPASGDLNYSVKINNKEVSAGTTTFGADVAAPVTVSSAGTYTFVITVGNAAGWSPKAQISAFIGADTPLATTARASWSDNVMTVTWLPVTAAVNGGYVDPDAITYTVTRYPDAEVVAENISECVFTETIAEPEVGVKTYYYDVVAAADGLKSETAHSNYVTLGSIVPPFAANFDDDELDGFLVVDANGDGRTWEAISGAARVWWNTTKAMDDWLLTPPLKLRAGQSYDISADISCQSTNTPERIEIKAGRGTKPEQMTTVLLEPTVITNKKDAPLQWNGIFIPEEDGIYFIGFHGISDPDCYYLFVDNFVISAPKSAVAPAPASDLTVTPGYLGALTAEIAFTTPDKALDGSALASLTKVELSRNSEVIKTWESPAPGTDITYTDNLDKAGEYIYTVVAYNAAGNGGEAAGSAYVGVDYPADITNVKAFETSTPGEVTITWDAVTSTTAGGDLASSQVTYYVYRYDGQNFVPVAGPVSETSFTYQAVAAGKQDFVQYAVFPVTDRGEGKGDISDYFPVGTPYQGMTITNASSLGKYILATAGYWYTYNHNNAGIYGQDDDWFLGMHGSIDDEGYLLTGLVSLEGMENPGFTFYTYNIGLDTGNADLNEVEIGIKEKGDADFTIISSDVIGETGSIGAWNRITVDLGAYAGKTVQLELICSTVNTTYSFFDNFVVGSLLSHDLGILDISAPVKVKTGEEYTVSVLVANEGKSEVKGYSVELYADGEPVATKPGADLASGERASIEYQLIMSPLATEPVSLHARIVYDADQDDNNNQSGTISVEPLLPALPEITDLTADVVNNAVELTWSEPDVASAPGRAVTEDFEDAQSFSATYGDWIFVDGDKSPVGGFQGSNPPCFTPGESTGSFWTWDCDKFQSDNSSFEAHSGTKYLFSMFRYDEEKSDDWAISPELDGSAQFISFWAKSYHTSYLEKIEIYYSTGSTDIADFVKIEGVGGDVPAYWTQYDVKLPAGAKRFAINSCAEGAFMLMIDDVTYSPAGSIVDIQLLGYNVYRNGVKLNDATVEECEFTDPDVEAAKMYTYVVTAVYSNGESAASNSVVINDLSGIESIGAGALTISAARNAITVTGADGMHVAVYAVDGKTVYAGEGKASTVIPAQQGVYVVKAGTTVRKVLVK